MSCKKSTSFQKFQKWLNKWYKDGSNNGIQPSRIQKIAPVYMKKAMERISSPKSEIRKDEKGTLLIPSHQQLASISMSIPKGKVITEDMLREILAREVKVDRVCQLATPWFIKELGDYYQFLKKRFGKIIPLDVIPPWLLSGINTYYSGGFRYITIDKLPPIWRIVGDNGELDGHFYNFQKYMLKQEIEGLKLEYVKGKKPERKVFGSGRKIVRHPERIQNFQQYLVDTQIEEPIGRSS